MHTFQIGKAFSGGFNAFKQNFGSLLIVFLITLFINALGFAIVNGPALMEIANNPEAATSTSDFSLDDTSSNGQFGFSASYDSNTSDTYNFMPAGGILGLIVNLLTGSLTSLLITVVTLSAVMGRKFQFSEIKANLSKYPKFLIATILFALLGLLFIIPIIGWIGVPILFLMYSQTFPILVEEDLKVTTSMEKSKELMKGNKLRLFGLGILLGLLASLLAAILFAIPFVLNLPALSILSGAIFILIVGPLYSCIVTHVYKQLVHGPKLQQEVKTA